MTHESNVYQRTRRSGNQGDRYAGEKRRRSIIKTFDMEEFVEVILDHTVEHLHILIIREFRDTNFSRSH